MIYTVTTNPNIDYYMNLRAPLRRRHQIAPAATACAGGKGINVFADAANARKPSCVLGYLAGPTGGFSNRS